MVDSQGSFVVFAREPSDGDHVRKMQDCVCGFVAL
jgi:hypothetical protein